MRAEVLTFNSGGSGARPALDGMSAQLGAAGVDLGAMEEAPVEEAVAEQAPAADATEAPAAG